MLLVILILKVELFVLLRWLAFLRQEKGSSFIIWCFSFVLKLEVLWVSACLKLSPVCIPEVSKVMLQRVLELLWFLVRDWCVH